MKLSVVSGGFDPLHIGHLELLERSAAIADKLFVIVNTDQFLANKKGKPFMPLRERMMIVQALKPVNLIPEFRFQVCHISPLFHFRKKFSQWKTTGSEQSSKRDSISIDVSSIISNRG